MASTNKTSRTKKPLRETRAAFFQAEKHEGTKALS
jgi:hypothetical protein